ncbi:Conserved oligomeric Golgi complex subunit 3 [Acropora cervicornis]|uniref:Conserved oligomeric Golgi complex subunit 3 n=1 Tax=Acropora cervicornis TaxID=6130 RepID=A0AAD9QS14_ACRCE|nr:Conserved oligomeric Golgi complex subunit 3 [Acropora cervicornis]
MNAVPFSAQECHSVAIANMAAHSGGGMASYSAELPDDDVTNLPAKRVLNDDSKETAIDMSRIDLGSEKIENSQQFFAWFAKVEAQMEEEQESSYRTYAAQLSSYRSHCDSILNQVEAALCQLEDLKQKHLLVSTKTGALHEACEQLLQDQTKLMNMAESISNKLSYFNTLDHLRHKLNSSAFSVTSESFVPMLARLDECISFLSSNPQFKESSVYLLRFKQCLNQALNQVKLHVISLLKNATAQVLAAKSLMEQIEQRIHLSSEYSSLLNDCQQCYLSQRSLLRAPSVIDAVDSLAKQYERNPCTLVRAGCSLLIHFCRDEYSLYYHFFSKPSPGLEVQSENNLIMISLRVGEELAAFEVVVLQMLEDVQERLVYRAQMTSDAEKEEKSTEAEEKGSSELPAALADLQGMWYPTVRRTLVCLSKLYRCISDAINGHLFLIKHLLILREQIAPFDVDFAVKEMSLDFSKMKTAAYGLWSHSNRLFALSSSNAILEFLLDGAPQLTENYLDSKKDVDVELRIVCEQFIQSVSESLIAPLSAFLAKAKVQDYYKQMNDLVTETYSEEDQQIIGCPSIQQVSLLLAVS